MYFIKMRVWWLTLQARLCRKVTSDKKADQKKAQRSPIQTLAADLQHDHRDIRGIRGIRDSSMVVVSL